MVLWRAGSASGATDNPGAGMRCGTRRRNGTVKESSSRSPAATFVALQRIPELDGLRGLAIALVLLFHCRDAFESVGLGPVVAWGWSGVDLFFVLSGFLITRLLIEARPGPRYFVNFYARRALRIWPVYFLLLVVAWFFVPWALGSFAWGLHEAAAAPWAQYAFFVQNLCGMATAGAVGPTWSLAIEEQYYVVWAPFVRFVGARTLKVVLVAVLLASPAIRFFGGADFGQPHTLIHLDGLAAGSLIAVVLATARLARAAWARLSRVALTGGVVVAPLALAFDSAWAASALAAGFAGLLIRALLATGGGGWTSRALTLWPLRFLGKISYGLYMVHLLCFQLLASQAGLVPGDGVERDLIVVAVRLSVAIAVATAMWYGVERPILTLKRRFGATDPACA